MLSEERRTRIQEVLEHQSTVTIADLAQRFGISEMTIRRDLDALAARGVCKRIHGGAMKLGLVVSRASAYPVYASRAFAQAREKTAIALAAASLVGPGDTIAIDSGTTATYLARALRGSEGITVISNSVQVLGQLRGASGTTLISPGGIFHVEEGYGGEGEWSFAGPLAVAALRGFRPVKAFITTSGVTIADGISNALMLQAEIKRTLIEIAEEAILLTDHTKFGRANGMIVAPLTAFRRVITDTSTPQQTVTEIESLGVDVLLVKPADEPISLPSSPLLRYANPERAVLRAFPS